MEWISGLEDPPPGSGLNAVIAWSPGVLTSVDVSSARIMLDDT